MKTADRIDIAFPAGAATYDGMWDGDDRRGVLTPDSQTTTPTLYDRK